MDIIIQSLGFKASEHLNSFVNEKLSKFDHGDNKIIRADVTLFKEESAQDSSYCEIRLEVPGNDHFVKKHGADFEQAITNAVDALQVVVRKSKEKLLDRRHS